MANKNLIIRTIVLITATVFFIILAITGTIKNNVNQEEKFIEISFQKIAEGPYGNINQKQTKIIKSSVEWADFWTEMFPTQMIASALNFIDKIVIAILQGQKPTGGYSIKIEKILDKEDYIEIIIKETLPEENCFLTQFITSPYFIATMKKSNKPLKFVIQEEKFSCQ